MATRWTITRSGDRVRIDVIDAAGFKETDTEAIEQALEEYLADPDVKIIRFDGPILGADELPDGLGGAIRQLGTLARARGKRFDVGPI